MWTAHHAVWDSYDDRKVRSKNFGGYAFISQQTGEPSYDSAHDGDSPSPRGRRHQHHPCLVGSRLAQHYKRLRRSRSRDEGQSARNLRDPRRSAEALEKGRRANAVPGLLWVLEILAIVVLILVLALPNPDYAWRQSIEWQQHPSPDLQGTS